MTKQLKQPVPLPVYRMPKPDAKITDGVLRSKKFSDIYFSAENGLAEKRHVFIDGTNLEHRINSQSHLVIAETGFGTGLNFLAVLDLLEKSSSDCRIDYISFEAYPLDAKTAFDARKPFVELQYNSTLLKEVWPESWACAHHRLFLQDRVHLHLHFSDAIAAMKMLDFKADIWFLDGFSPWKNAELWSEEIFLQVARLSAQNANISSFSVAALVKEGLVKAGFKVEKKKGFGKKREMLKGWYNRTAVPLRNLSLEKNVIIIGGGIAGASIAHGLRASNIPHIILEEADAIAQGASGNPAGLQTPQLMAAPHPSMQMSLSCFSYARQLAVTHDVVLDRGVISLNHPKKQGARQKKMAYQEWPEDLVKVASARQLSKNANIEIQTEGFIQSAGQLIDPSKLTCQLLDKSEVQTGISIMALSKKQGMWELKTTNGSVYTATDVVLAIGSGLPQFLEKFQLPSLKLQVTSGQLSFLPNNTNLNKLNCSLQYGGYLTPMIDGIQVLGASFDLSGTMQLTEQSHRHNLSLLPKELQNHLPESLELKGRVSRRLASQDRGPLVGDWLDTIHLFSALGSRGLTNAPLLGLVLARKIATRPSGLNREILRIIDPNRFSIRTTRTRHRR